LQLLSNYFCLDQSEVIQNKAGVQQPYF